MSPLLTGLFVVAICSLAVALAGVVWQYVLIRKVPHSLSLWNPEWRRLTRSARKWLAAAAISMPVLMYVAAIPAFIGYYRLIQVCSLTGSLFNSVLLQKRAKQAVRNWWILLGETLGFVPIAIILGLRSGETPFVWILAGLLLAFWVYVFVFLLVLLRIAANTLQEAAREARSHG